MKTGRKCLHVLRLMFNLLLRSHLFRWSIVLYGITFFILLPIACHDMKHSMYFAKNEDDVIKSFVAENEERLLHLNDAIEKMRTKHSGRLCNSSKPLVVISIITQSRAKKFRNIKEPYYLSQTVTRFLELAQEFGPDFPLKLIVCNVDSDPENYEEAQDMRRLVEVVNRFKKLSLSLDHPKERERQDYVFCLNASLAYRAQYVFLVEDDALPRDDSLRVLQHIVQYMSSHSRQGKPAYIKFYHPERLLQFFSMGIERIPELVSLSAVLSTLVMALSTLFVLSLGSDTRKLYCLWGYWFIFFVLVCLSVGRTNLLTFRRIMSPHLYATTPTPSCCTQAILYPRQSAVGLVESMAKKTCSGQYAKDHIVDEFPREIGQRALLVQPNVFKHIGLYSAVRGRMVNPILL